MSGSVESMGNRSVRPTWDRLLAGQLLLIVLAWVCVAWLHWGNDGLWFQGDAPRHALNGVFWKDFLLSGDVHPVQFAFRYYARYPAISLPSYPPVFYLVEGAAYVVFGISPYVAKGVVLAFGLLAAVYLLLWLRRWVSEEVGGMAVLLLLLPAFVRYANAVMLNVPATALSLAALYHARRWLEGDDPDAARRQFYLAAGLSLLTVLTYYPAAIILPILLAWVAVLNRWRLLRSVRVLAAAAGGALLLAPFLFMAWRWAPEKLVYVTGALNSAPVAAGWILYLQSLPRLAGPYALIVAAAGLLMIGLTKTHRREIVLLLVFLVVGLASLSLLRAWDPRYAMILCAPLIGLGAIGVQEIWIGSAVRLGLDARHAAQWLPLVAVAACLPQALATSSVTVPRVRGFAELAAFLRAEPSADRVLYDGQYNGVFVYYVRAGDSHYRRQVVNATAVLSPVVADGRRADSSGSRSVQDMVTTLRERGGCRWLAIEVGADAERSPMARLLREAVRSPFFKLVRSFDVSGPGVERVDLYRITGDVNPKDAVDLQFPDHPDADRSGVTPITERKTRRLEPTLQ